MENLHFIPNNILIKSFKELTKYKDDYQYYLNYIYKNYRGFQPKTLINANILIDIIYYLLFNTFHTYISKPKKKRVYVSLSLSLFLSSIITFFSALSFSSIAFLQLNSIAFLLIPIGPPCSLPHQQEHSRSCLMIMKVVFSTRNHYKEVLVALISSGCVLFIYIYIYIYM